MPHARIAGVAVNVDSGLQWELSVGTKAYSVSIKVLKDRASKIYGLAKKGPVKLEIGERVFESVYVVSLASGKSSKFRTLELRDLRWRWPGKLISKAFNKRRQTNNRRRIEDPSSPNTPVVAQNVVPDVDYYQYSLKPNGAVYTLRECFVEIFKEIGDKYRITGKIPSIPVEDIDETKSADEWLAFLLQYSPGLTVFVDYDGTVILKNTRDESELKEIRQIVPYRESGTITGVDLTNLRPSKINLYFEQRQDLAFYFDSAAHFAPVQPDEERGRERRNLIPIVINPLLSLDVNGRKVAQGTPIDEREYYLAVQKIKRPPAPIDRDSLYGKYEEFAVRDGYMAPHKLKFGFVDDYTANLENQIWQRIVGASLKHKRRTFQITKPWFDRIRNYYVELSSLQDQENLAFSPAKAYCTYTVKPTLLGITPTMRDKRAGYIVRKDNFLVDGEVAAPADVTIPQGGKGSGLLRVYLLRDFTQEQETIVPGEPSFLAKFTDDIFTKNIGKVIGTVFTDDTSVLVNDWKLTVLISVQRGAPNSKGRLHKHSIEPKDVEKLVGHKIGSCRGPEWDIYIQPTPTTMARWRWSDEFAAEIDNSFFDGTPMPEELLSNASDIEHIARAAAARIYSALIDRPTGQAVFSQSSGFAPRPVGSISRVQHFMNSDGSVGSAVYLPRELAVQDINEFLPRSIIRRLEGFVQ